MTTAEQSFKEAAGASPHADTITHGRHRGGTRQFLRHLGEMVLAMMLGMIVLGAAFGTVLAAAGLDLGKIRVELPGIFALVMAFNMTAPMALWMRHRGHRWAYTAEMSAAMFVPVLALLPLLGLRVISGGALIGIEHAAMIPSMVVVMFRHREEFAG